MSTKITNTPMTLTDEPPFCVCGNVSAFHSGQCRQCVQQALDALIRANGGLRAFDLAEPARTAT